MLGRKNLDNLTVGEALELIADDMMTSGQVTGFDISGPYTVTLVGAETNPKTKKLERRKYEITKNIQEVDVYTVKKLYEYV